jgi:hypothetical protein
MRIANSLLVVAALVAACNAPAPAPAPSPAPPAPATVTTPLAPYQQLVGAWVDNTSNARLRYFESWQAQGDSLLLGKGFVLAKQDTVFIEDLKLELMDGNVLYSARIDTQNNGAWVPFTAQPSGQDSLVFENPGHDFPQCITYVKDSLGAWDVAVSGNENGAERTERFHFKQQ